MEWISIISIVVGVILAFFGFKVQKAVISLAWFMIGFGISNYICPNFISNEYLLLGINIVASNPKITNTARTSTKVNP